MSLETALYTVTCHEPGCPNEDVPLTVVGSAVDPVIVCGAHVDADGFNEPMTDISPT